ncbi:MAG: hypothetical protein JWN03_5223 [Nocardia sp.]|nr:hypothetical protein [Nocardia sp.]
MKGLSMCKFNIVRRGVIAAVLISSFTVPGAVAAAQSVAVTPAGGNGPAAELIDANTNNSGQTDPAAPNSGQSGSSSGGSSSGGSSFTGPSFNGGSSGGSLSTGSAADLLGRALHGVVTGS